MPKSSQSTGVGITRIEAARARTVTDDPIAVEEPLEIRVEGKPVAVVMRTPGHDEELAAGFLLTEGVIRSKLDVFEIRHCPSVGGISADNVIDALLVRITKADLKRLTRHVFTSSSCGICGKGSIEAVHQQFAPVENHSANIRAATIKKLPTALRRGQKIFAKTGGLHAAAVFDRGGKHLVLREDVGRHNAVDKVLGHALLGGHLPLENHLLFVSGRVSFEIMQKALAARIPFVGGISAPTSLAVEFARDSGQTLVGFVRDDGMNVYSHPERITSGISRAQ